MCMFWQFKLCQEQKTHLNQIGRFSVNQIFQELFESLGIDTLFCWMQVQVSESDSGPWKDAELIETVELLTAFGTYICFCVGEAERREVPRC